MSEASKTLKQLIMGILIFIGPILIIGTLLVEDKMGYILGVSLGAGSSIVLLLHMNYSIGESLKRTPKAAERYAITNYFVRGLIIIIVVLLAVLIEEIHIVGTLLGMFAIKGSAFIYPYLNRNNKVEPDLDNTTNT